MNLLIARSQDILDSIHSVPPNAVSRAMMVCQVEREKCGDKNPGARAEGLISLARVNGKVRSHRAIVRVVKGIIGRAQASSWPKLGRKAQ